MPAADQARRPASARRGRGSARAAWVPKQHGAWAMLTVPFLVGAVLGGLAPAHLPLLVAWIVGYLCFAATGLWLRSRRRPAYRPAVLTYGAIALVAGLVLLLLRPEMAWWAPVFAPFAAVSLVFSARRDDRSIVNDVVTIVAACLMTAVAAHAGHRYTGTTPTALVGDSRLVAATAALTAYFVGTSLYVKTLIRERTSRAYRTASIGYHAAATALAALLPLAVPGVVPGAAHLLLVVFFLVTTVRAAVMAGRRVSPMKVGLGEIALSAALALILLVAW